MSSVIYLMLGISVLLGLVLAVLYRVEHQKRPRRGWAGDIGYDASSGGGEQSYHSHHSHIGGHGHDFGGGDGGGH